VRRIFLALPGPLNVAYAIGALAGLRTGEVFALRWTHVDLAARRIHVRESIKGPLKDGDSRIVPVLDALLRILNERKLKSGGDGRVIPAMRCDGKKIDKATPGNYLRAALEQLELTQPGPCRRQPLTFSPRPAPSSRGAQLVVAQPTRTLPRSSPDRAPRRRGSSFEGAPSASAEQRGQRHGP